MPEKRKATTAMEPARTMGFYDPSYRASQSHINSISGMAFFPLFAWPVSKVDRDPSMAFEGRVETPRISNGSLNPVSQPLKGWVAAAPDRVADGASLSA